jgi:hypothetical protein
MIVFFGLVGLCFFLHYFQVTRPRGKARKQAYERLYPPLPRPTPSSPPPPVWSSMTAAERRKLALTSIAVGLALIVVWLVELNRP